MHAFPWKIIRNITLTMCRAERNICCGISEKLRNAAKRKKALPREDRR
jgi:hypothetical protein